MNLQARRFGLEFILHPAELETLTHGDQDIVDFDASIAGGIEEHRAGGFLYRENDDA